MIGPSGQPAWKDAVRNRLLTRRTEPKAVRCVKDLIDHIIIESVKLYESTYMEDKFTMFHDALSAWNEGAVQEYIKDKYPGFEHRFIITPVGKTCAGIIYKSKPPATRLRTRGAWTRSASPTSRARCASTAPCRGSTRTATSAGSSAISEATSERGHF